MCIKNELHLVIYLYCGYHLVSESETRSEFFVTPSYIVVIILFLKVERGGIFFATPSYIVVIILFLEVERGWNFL